MRELKFRAWDGSQMLTEENFDFVVSDYNSIIRLDEYGWTEHWVDCVEQYTGLKDKNGKEIYDGDIVNVIGIGIAQVIDSPSGEWMLYYKREPDEIKNGFACVMPKNKPRGLWKTNTTSYIEVIGNIHENPELLEEDE